MVLIIAAGTVKYSSGTSIASIGLPAVTLPSKGMSTTLSSFSKYSLGTKSSKALFLASFFDDNGTEYKEMAFAMRNGFIASVVPNRLFISAGLSTRIPSLTFRKDQDTEKGTLGNFFYLGAAFDLTPQVRICSDANIAISDGLSLEEAWKEVFNFSLQMKF